MAELRGAFTTIGLPGLLRLLAAQRQSGSLRVADGGWVGEIVFVAGRPVAAAVGVERGLAALDAIALALADGSFVFSSAAPPAPADDLGNADLVLARIDDLRFARTGWPASVLQAAPKVIEPAAPGPPVALERAALPVLTMVDGRRTIDEIAHAHGLARTVGVLARLWTLRLLGFAATEAARQVEGAAQQALAPAKRPDEGSKGAGAKEPANHRPAAPPGNGGPAVVMSQSAGAPAPAAGPGRAAALGGLRRSWPLVLAGALVFGGVRSAVQNFRVDGSSMAPTLANGQMVLIDKAAYWRAAHAAVLRLLPASARAPVGPLVADPQRGDLAVFHAPLEPGADYIKRIIGLPGDRILIDHDRLLVNGRPLREPYVRFPLPVAPTYPASGVPLRVPDDAYFVLGDNRADSVDSRSGWFVPARNLVGRAWLSIWPPPTWGVVPSRPSQGLVSAASGAEP